MEIAKGERAATFGGNMMEEIHERESSYRKFATILGIIVDPGVLLHRYQPKFRETNNGGSVQETGGW